LRLYIAEKPSMGREIAKCLKGPVRRCDGYLETGEGVVTWLFGHILRQAEPDGPVLNDQERAIARLLVEGNNTKKIAEAVHLGVNTVLWYRKRLYAKFDVHNAAAFSTEMSRRGLLE